MGNPDICNIYTIHRAFSDDTVQLEVEKGCRTASIGCIDCKKILFKKMWEELSPIQEKAASLTSDQGYVTDVLRQGAEACAIIAKETMREVREALGLLKP